MPTQRPAEPRVHSAPGAAGAVPAYFFPRLPGLGWSIPANPPQIRSTLVTAQPAAAPARSFVASLGFHADPVVPDGMKTVVNGRLEVDERHHTTQGIVHGGIWCTVIDSAATVGADNLTDFLRPVTTDTVAVQARPEQIGSTLQLWNVEIRSDTTGKLVAKGRVRLANRQLPAAGQAGPAPGTS
jgi:1,4-dihydroxy-2-naphthoyl-CoA hydrolase